MEIASFFPIWDEMTAEQQQTLLQGSREQSVPKGTMLHNGEADCTGLLLIQSGQLRAFSLSEDGREITLYRLFERDLCLFSASCMLSSIQFAVTIVAEKDSRFWIIPPDVYQQVMKSSAPLANYTGEILAQRMSEIMWLMEQIMWKSFDRRLAAFLLAESAIEGSSVLHITHETIGNHLGSPREVVTRMLRYFQSEGMVELARGSITLTDEKALWARSE